MNLSTLAIPLGFLLLTTLLCWYVIGAAGKWQHKLVAIVFVPLFSLVIWSAIPSYLGWPTDEVIPDKVRLLWVLIQEPDAEEKNAGKIFIWVQPLAEKPSVFLKWFDYISPMKEPRAYKFRYSRKMHEKLAKAQEGIQQGKVIIIDDATKLEHESGEGEPGQNNYDDLDEQEFDMYELPPASAPRKSEIVE